MDKYSMMKYKSDFLGKYCYDELMYLEKNYDKLSEDNEIKILLNSIIDNHFDKLKQLLMYLDQNIREYIDSSKYSDYGESSDRFRGIIIQLMQFNLQIEFLDSEDKVNYWKYVSFNFHEFCEKCGYRMPKDFSVGYYIIDDFINDWKEINEYD